MLLDKHLIDQDFQFLMHPVMDPISTSFSSRYSQTSPSSNLKGLYNKHFTPHFNHRQNNCSDSSEVICSLCKAKIQSCGFFFIRYLSFFFFIVVRSITKYAILTMKFRGTLTTLTILYNHHQYLFLKLFRYSKQKLCITRYILCNTLNKCLFIK